MARAAQHLFMPKILCVDPIEFVVAKVGNRICFWVAQHLSVCKIPQSSPDSWRL